jgi:long-subunit acyl-CoA synthetase (AMP-forming)
MAKRAFYDAVRKRDLRELIDHATRTHGDKVILREFNAHREIVDHTSRQLSNSAQALAAKLIADGFKGNQIALIGESAFDYVASYLAVANWVGVIVPIDRELSADETVKQLLLCDATAVFYSSSQQQKMASVLSQCPRIRLRRAWEMPMILRTLFGLWIDPSGEALLESGGARTEHSAGTDLPCTIFFHHPGDRSQKGVI